MEDVGCQELCPDYGKKKAAVTTPALVDPAEVPATEGSTGTRSVTLKNRKKKVTTTLRRFFCQS
jgi:hypothetical protein